MFDELTMYYIDYHIEHNFDYSILCSGVAIYLFQSMYKKGLKEGDAKPLTSLPKEKIYQYAEIGDKYKTELRNKEQVMMACYVLDFVTQKL